MAASFLRKQEILPEALIAKYGTDVGKSDARFIGVFAAELPDYQVTLQQGQSDQRSVIKLGLKPRNSIVLLTHK